MDLTIREIKEVAALISEKERIEAKIQKILGKEPPIKGYPKKKAAAAAADSDAPKAAPSPGRQLHGKYMSLIRSLSPANKAEAKRIRLAQGTEASVAYMEALPSALQPRETTTAPKPEQQDAFAEAGKEV